MDKSEENPESRVSRFTVSTNNQFNLIGDLSKFFHVEIDCENSVKPFQNNTNLKKLINFKINYEENHNWNPNAEANWPFWSAQFSGCSELESADIIFEIPNDISFER